MQYISRGLCTFKVNDTTYLCIHRDYTQCSISRSLCTFAAEKLLIPTSKGLNLNTNIDCCAISSAFILCFCSDTLLRHRVLCYTQKWIIFWVTLASVVHTKWNNTFAPPCFLSHTKMNTFCATVFSAITCKVRAYVHFMSIFAAHTRTPFALHSFRCTTLRHC